jgi:hypothetical protein
MDVAIEEAAMIRIEHDLSDGRASAFRHHAVHDAFAFGHPGAGKSHLKAASNAGRSDVPLTHWPQKSKQLSFIQ